jgi:MFS family permease
MASAQIDASKPSSVSSRWLIPLGAVLVHICIGSVYAWSTFNRPIIAVLPNAPSWFSPPYTTFTSALVILGLSAAFGGMWVERRGPRVAATAAALFFGAGLLIGGAGLALRQPVMVFLGMGVVGGIGCGLGYIAPVSTLVKWFPDRRGMATGMAIMGFGGGAAIASPMNTYFMKFFASPQNSARGVSMTMLTLGVIYLVVMLIGARILRRPPKDWKPEGWTPPVKKRAMITDVSVSRNAALGTPQFYLLWGILFINVSAGIGILSQASPMTQDMFSKTASEAAAVVSLISLFNLAGRFFWASSSDYIGRRNTYIVFFVVQFFLFLLIPYLAAQGNYVVFLASWSVIYTMYGGGFATIPAFLADIFGPENVGAIHGVILTAWSAAAVTGPVIITELSNRAKAALAPGASRVHIYDQPLQVLAAGLAAGFVLTLLVRPLIHPAKQVVT